MQPILNEHIPCGLSWRAQLSSASGKGEQPADIDGQTIYTKTAKGILMIRNKRIELPRDLGLIFLDVDGKASITELMRKSGLSEAQLCTALERLLAEDYIKVLHAASSKPPFSDNNDDPTDLDFTPSPGIGNTRITEAAARVRAEVAHAGAANEAKQRTDAAAARAQGETEERRRASAASEAPDARGCMESAMRTVEEAKALARAEAHARVEAEVRTQAEHRAREEVEAKAEAERKKRQEVEARIEAKGREFQLQLHRARDAAEAAANAERAAREEAIREAIKATEVKTRAEVETTQEAERASRAEAEAHAVAERIARDKAVCQLDAARAARQEAERRIRDTAAKVADEALGQVHAAAEAAREAKPILHFAYATFPKESGMTAPHTLVSLWDMLKLCGDKFISVESIYSVNPEQQDQVENIGRLKKHLADEVIPRLDGMGLRQSAKKARAMVNAPYDVIHSMSELRSRIRDELEDGYFLRLTEAQSKLIEDQEPFGRSVTEKFGSLEHIVEASKCLGFGCTTASMFHLMRIMKVAIEKFGEELGVSLIDVCNEKPWRNIVDDANNAINEMDQNSPVTKAYARITALLYNVKLAWRNEVMHPKDTYTEAEAQNVFTAVKAFMIELSSVL